MILFLHFPRFFGLFSFFGSFLCFFKRFLEIFFLFFSIFFILFLFLVYFWIEVFFGIFKAKQKMSLRKHFFIINYHKLLKKFENLCLKDKFEKILPKKGINIWLSTQLLRAAIKNNNPTIYSMNILIASRTSKLGFNSTKICCPSPV